MKENLKLIIKNWSSASHYFKEDLKKALFYFKYRLGIAKEDKDFIICNIEDDEI